MNHVHSKITLKVLISSLLISLVMLTAFSCIPVNDTDFVESLLKNTESGKMTLVSEDGEKVTITVTKETQTTYDNDIDTKEIYSEEKSVENKETDSTADLAEILPTLNSIEDVFKTLGLWEDAAHLRENGLTWSHIAAEFGYTKETMYAHLEEDIEARLSHAKELGLITHEQLEYKYNHYTELAMKWIGKIFTDTEKDNAPDLAEILPTLNSIEDVFKTLGLWEDAAHLREKGLTWSHIAAEFGYTEDKMYAYLEEDIEERLRHAKELGLITHEQVEYKYSHYTELAMKWIGTIFADVEKEDTPSLAEILPTLNSIEDVFKTLGVWEDAAHLRENGLTWSHIAAEFGYNEETMYAHLEENIEARLRHAKELGLLSHEQVEYKYNHYTELAMKWIGQIFTA